MLGWEKYQNRLERAKLINAILGKNAQEIASMDLADKTKIDTKPEPLGTIYPQESENISDEDFNKVIEKQNG